MHFIEKITLFIGYLDFFSSLVSSKPQNLITMRHFYLAILLCTSFVINAQNLQIKDVNFENALISQGYDVGSPDGLIEMKNLTQVLYLDVSGESISDLSGIEAFANLEVLIADNNEIRTLDLSQNTSLRELSVFNNKITSLNIANNTRLENLNVYRNRLSDLNLLNNRDLRYLAAADNNLTELDLVNNRQLVNVYCQNNQLTSFDVSNTPLLEILNCEYNNLSNLNIDNSNALVQLNAGNNNLTTLSVNTNTNLEQINVLYNNITALDLSNNVNLSLILVAYNQLESLNIRNGNNANIRIYRSEGNINLECVTSDDDIADTNAENVTGRWNKDFNTNFSINCERNDEADNSIEEGGGIQRSFSFFVGEDKTLNVTSNQKASLNIINLQGVSILNKDINEGSNAISMNNATGSIYILQINSKLGTYNKKFILN